MRKVRVMLDSRVVERDGIFHTFANFDGKTFALVEGKSGVVLKYNMHTFDLVFLDPPVPDVSNVPTVPFTSTAYGPGTFKDFTNPPKPYHT